MSRCQVEFQGTVATAGLGSRGVEQCLQNRSAPSSGEKSDMKHKETYMHYLPSGPSLAPPSNSNSPGMHRPPYHADLLLLPAATAANSLGFGQLHRRTCRRRHHQAILRFAREDRQRAAVTGRRGPHLGAPPPPQRPHVPPATQQASAHTGYGTLDNNSPPELQFPTLSSTLSPM